MLQMVPEILFAVKRLARAERAFELITQSECLMVTPHFEIGLHLVDFGLDQAHENGPGLFRL